MTGPNSGRAGVGLRNPALPKKFLKSKIIFALLVVAMLFGIAATLVMKGPAMASRSYNNANIATDALTHVGEKYGECWPFVRDMIYQASKHTQDITTAAGGNDYFLHLQNAGGARITDINALSKGDVVQKGEYGGHTFIIVSKVSVSGSTATYNVVDSNHLYNNDVVMKYNRTFSLSNDERVYRFGTVNGSSGWPGVGSATFLGSDHLNPGQVMHSSQYILSGNVQYVLIMQSDGNLVEYHYQSAVWANGKNGNPGAYLGFQSDGNIVEYTASGSPIWATNTNGQSLAYLVMQSDGNLVAYNTSNPPSPIWANNEGGNANHSYFGLDRLYNGQRMTGDYFLRSADLRYAVLMQADGNLVLFGPGYHVLWANGKNGHPGAYLGLQSDGNIVEYSSSGTALWATNTGGKSLSYLIMQSDGNLVAYGTNGVAIWASNTAGEI